MWSTSKLRILLLLAAVTWSVVGLRAQTAPGIPTMTSAVAYSRATVYFSAPASDGGSTITLYTATSSPGGITGTITGAQKLMNPDFPIHVSGLTAGQSYTFTVTATNGVGTSLPSSASNSVTPSAALVPTSYSAPWEDAGAGAIPARATRCGDVIAAATYGNGAQSAQAGIQAALNACGSGEHVKLGPGVFLLNTPVLVPSNVTLRGSGTAADVGFANATILYKKNALSNTGSGGEILANATGELVVIGASRSPTGTTESTAVSLTVDAVQGDTSVTVSSATGFSAGQIVKIDADEYTTSRWASAARSAGTETLVTLFTDRLWYPIRCEPNVDVAPTPNGDGVVDCTPGTAPTTAVFPGRSGSVPVPGGLTWHSRAGRNIAEIKEVASVSGNTITFTTPLMIDFPLAKLSQVIRYAGTQHVRYAGVEDLTMTNGSAGVLTFRQAAYSWVKNVEGANWGGVGIELLQSFKCTVRDSYIHAAQHPYPGGGGYVFGLNFGTSEILVENNILMGGNKLIVVRSSGAGSVFGYNYIDDGYVGSNLGWMEHGLSTSHMAGSHHMLMEGNRAFNYDQDDSWGSSIYNVAFRNHLTGDRRSFPETQAVRTSGPACCNWWNAIIGNVLGESGAMSGWIYEDPGDRTYGHSASLYGGKAIFRIGNSVGVLGFLRFPENKTRETTIRDGNFDYVTNEVRWDRTDASLTLPDSLYLAAKPSFFGSDTWPWVDPEGATKVYTLPAKTRADTYIAAATVPTAPAVNLVTRVGTTNTVSVRIAPPHYNGGQVITLYTVTSSPGGITANSGPGPTGKNNPIVIGPLSLSTQYTFTVTATNSVGTSAASAASDPITLDGTEPPPPASRLRVARFRIFQRP